LAVQQTPILRAGASETDLAAAVDANEVELWRVLCAHTPGAEFHDDPDRTWFLTGIRAGVWYNQVLAARLEGDAIDAQIDSALAPFRERGLAGLWTMGPSTRPADLPSRLEAHGLAPRTTMPGMAAGLAALPAPQPVAGLRIERVSDRPSLDRWGDAYIAGFEMEEAAGRALAEIYARIGFSDDAPARHYAGWLDGRPVASSTLFLGAGVAGVFHVGTLPAVRRRGIGAAMTLAPLRDALALGYHIGVLFASAMGRPVYERLGFRQCCTLSQCRWSPEAPA
jgi:GNAT superfamily N-acetyltransferase